MLADTKPDWPIGTAHGYHALTFGWLAGELIRRTDGRSPGQFVADEIAGPLGVDLWIGLPEEQEPRVSPIIGRPLTEDNPRPDVRAMIEMFLGPGTRGGRALFLNGAFRGDDACSTGATCTPPRSPRPTASPTPRSLAKVYAATMARSTACSCSTTTSATGPAPRSRRTASPTCAWWCRPRSAWAS